MPHIPDFPKDLLDQHHQWHQVGAHGPVPLRLHPMGTPGGGTEFLVFHRNFSAQVMAWYNTTTFSTDPFDKPAQKASLVAPWKAVPVEMRALPDFAPFRNDEIRLETGSPNFDSDDDLGYFIESRIHNNFLHGAAADVFQEEEVRSLHSPGSSLFYKIHGLVDYWWSKWQRRNFLFPNRPVPSLSGQGAGSPVFFPDRPVPRVSPQALPPSADQFELAKVIDRIKLLESLAYPMRAIPETVAEHLPADANPPAEKRYSGSWNPG